MEYEKLKNFDENDTTIVVCESIMVKKEKRPVDFDVDQSWESFYLFLKVSVGYMAVLFHNNGEMLNQGEVIRFEIQKNQIPKILVMGQGEVEISLKPIIENGAKEKSKITLEDFKLSFKIMVRNFPLGNRIIKSLKNVWYDLELKKQINKVQRFYLPQFLGLFTTGVLGFSLLEVVTPSRVFTLTCAWLITYIFLIMPLVYSVVLPRPIKKHIKAVCDLNEYEQKIYDKEKKENPRAERILKKYKITGKNKYTK